jgi:hypothetical protein
MASRQRRTCSVDDFKGRGERNAFKAGAVAGKVDGSMPIGGFFIADALQLDSHFNLRPKGVEYAMSVAEWGYCRKPPPPPHE